MTQSTGERIYRACVRCRRRKVRCDLRAIGEAGRPPCIKCYVEGSECVLAGSRRGGDYSHYRSSASSAVRPSNNQHAPTVEAHRLAGTGTSRSGVRAHRRTENNDTPGSIQNPLQALEMLAQVAATGNDNALPQAGEPDSSFDELPTANVEDEQHVDDVATSFESLHLARLDLHVLSTLIQSYRETYHAFLPVVPRHILGVRDVQRIIRDEAFVLTAVLLIATKYRFEYAAMHTQMWEAMQKMLLQVVLGASEVRTAGCVEGLLILAEWVPHANVGTAHINVSQKGTGGLAGSEDTAAWTLVGLAVRQAYLLHLDKYAFRDDAQESGSAVHDRERLAWTFTYIADRQISIRMGQGFWCRGPSLATKFTACDFPSLQAQAPYEDDYASILQAQLELTVLFGNIHDLLYANKRQSISLMLAGDYTKYLDDSMQGLDAWKQAWGGLTTGRHFRIILDVQHEYLRLYIHGFAFQAAVSRLPKGPFPNGVLATPDGRHVLLAISAAKSVLEMFGRGIDPVRHLRYLGPRFYLYAIHCAVFLYKAASYGAIGEEERRGCVEIVQQYTGALQAAAVTDEHIAARHAALLTSLWSAERAGSASSSSNGQQTDDTLSATARLLDVDLQGADQFFNDLDVFSFVDFGAYGEPDLRNLISL